MSSLPRRYPLKEREHIPGAKAPFEGVSNVRAKALTYLRSKDKSKNNDSNQNKRNPRF